MSKGCMEISAEIRKGATSLYEDQLQKGFESLRFGDFLEEDFRDNYLQENFQKSRLVIGLSLIVVVVVTLVNIYSSNGPSPIMGRFGVSLMTPMLLVTLFASYSGHRFIYQAMLALSALVIGVAGSVVDVQASLAGQGYYFAGQIGCLDSVGKIVEVGREVFQRAIAFSTLAGLLLTAGLLRALLGIVAHLRNAMGYIIDHVEPGHTLLVQKVNRLTLLLAKNSN